MNKYVILFVVSLLSLTAYGQIRPCYEVLNDYQYIIGESFLNYSATSNEFTDLQGTRYMTFTYVFPQWNWVTPLVIPVNPSFSNPVVVQIPWCVANIQVTGPCVDQWAFAPIFNENDPKYIEFTGYTDTTIASIAIYIDNQCYASVAVPERILNVTFTLNDYNALVGIAPRNYSYAFSPNGNAGFSSLEWEDEMCTDIGLDCLDLKPANESIPFDAAIITQCFNMNPALGQLDWIFILQNRASRPVFYSSFTCDGTVVFDSGCLMSSGRMLAYSQIYFQHNNASVDYNIFGLAGSYNAGGRVPHILRSSLPYFQTVPPANETHVVCTCGSNINCYTNGTYMFNVPMAIPNDNNWNFLPIAIVHWTPTRPRLNQPILFDGRMSYDPAAGSSGTYSYDWAALHSPYVSQPPIFENSTAILTNVTFMRSGDYVIRLAITDSLGTGSKDVAIKAINSRPIARIQAKPRGGLLGGVINVTTIGTHDPDGLPLPLSYDWICGNGTLNGTCFGTSNTSTNITVFIQEFNFTVCLQVFDGDKYSILNRSSCILVYVTGIPPAIPSTPLEPPPDEIPIAPGNYPPSVTSPQAPAFTRPPNSIWSPFNLAPNSNIIPPSPAQTPSQINQGTWFSFFVIMVIAIAFVAGFAFKKFGQDRQRKKTRLEQEQQGVQMTERHLLLDEDNYHKNT